MTSFLAFFEVTQLRIRVFQGRVTAFSAKNDVTASFTRKFPYVSSTILFRPYAFAKICGTGQSIFLSFTSEPSAATSHKPQASIRCGGLVSVFW